jgi:hypothetical protein
MAKIVETPDLLFASESMSAVHGLQGERRGPLPEIIDWKIHGIDEIGLEVGLHGQFDVFDPPGDIR